MTTASVCPKVSKGLENEAEFAAPGRLRRTKRSSGKEFLHPFARKSATC
jgi:hypothetical protein